MEMVLVIVIMGVFASGISRFLSFGIQIYSETSMRDQLISSARFVVERLNRELRNAVPNSIEVNPAGCLTFAPMVASTIYTDIAVEPEDGRDRIRVIRFDEAPATLDIDTWIAVVFPSNSNDVFEDLNNRRAAVNELVTFAADEWEIELDDEVAFAQHSPTQRIFFIDDDSQVKYCLVGTSLFRSVGNTPPVLMAENITNTNVFKFQWPALQRNALVQIFLQFEQFQEKITFHNEVQVPNVP